MEVGAVVGAVPAANVVREEPTPGDVIILLGGKTGRDGCGGATGSSKSHNVESLSSCGAEVQKGNPPEERKIQRLFRDGDVTRMIKRCNDFGAGGVSVAIGELADGLKINLDLVPKKYDGLDGTELAISESQERMAVVVAKENVEKFMQAADRENLMATAVAEVTEDPRLVMFWREKKIVDLSRAFLNSNGAPKYTKVIAKAPAEKEKCCCKNKGLSVKEKFEKIMGELNVASQKGLSDRFDSTIGANTVMMPYGGKTQLTPAQAMVAKIPVRFGETNTCSVMAWGFNPYISEENQFRGAQLAVIESIAKLIAVGGTRHKCWLSFQEYFEKIGTDPEKWGKPFQSLLGALKAQLELGCAAIGGKDSMSGSFEDIHVPPTLISFAVSATKAQNIVSGEFKAANDKVYLLTPEYDENGLPVYESIRKVFDHMESLIAEGKVKAVYTLGSKGIGEALCKMAFGNRIGFAANDKIHHLFKPTYGAFVFEAAGEVDTFAKEIGHTTEEYAIDVNGEKVCLDEIQKVWEATLEPVYPMITKAPNVVIPSYSYECKEHVDVAVAYIKHVRFIRTETLYYQVKSLRVRLCPCDVLAANYDIHRQRACLLIESIDYPIAIFRGNYADFYPCVLQGLQNCDSIVIKICFLHHYLVCLFYIRLAHILTLRIVGHICQQVESVNKGHAYGVVDSPVVLWRITKLFQNVLKALQNALGRICKSKVKIENKISVFAHNKLLFKQQGQPFADCPVFYSTVTDFARFLGLSTSLPLRTEV